MTFLFFATSLQCVRQYIIGNITQRSNDKCAAKKTKGHKEEHSDRKHRFYNPTLEQVINNPVPFDATFGSKDFDLGIGGGFTHRAKTLGHDPILGWIFGTMNIATSTLTVAETGIPKSYHIKTSSIKNGNLRDKISYNANTLKIINFSKEKLFNQGIVGKEIIGASLIKEAIHLRSDLYSTVSLPLPFISSLSTDYARKIAQYGLDMGNIIKIGMQAEFSILINSIIGMAHGLFYETSNFSSWSMYSVKTRKILMYSNVIASTSNVIAVAISSIYGDAKSAKNYLDIGGIMVTIYRIVNDKKFIRKIKEEFLEQEFYNLIMDEY